MHVDVMRSREQDFTPAESELLSQVAHQIAIAIENALVYQEIAALKERLSKEKTVFRRRNPDGIQIRGDHRAKSVTLEEGAQAGEVVAPTDSTVLVLGETGTGKELIPRALHDRSGRRTKDVCQNELCGHPDGPPGE